MDVKFKVQCLKVSCCHGNKSTILPFNSMFRTSPEVSTKLFVEISKASEKLWLFNRKRADFLVSKFWIFYHFSASLKTFKCLCSTLCSILSFYNYSVTK